ncbi:MAG: hypothetical protein EWM47_13755 [Anaerolineaceae bacterium]|nr:MAG: hypothetical protein EWM47_13755 [Anaerolineaceae bacterium]
MSMLFIPNETQPQKAIVLKDSVYHSFLGEYFIGQTDMISYGGDLQAWGGLFNPPDSRVNMFLNAYTISNFSNQPITVEGWLGAACPGRAVISNHVAAGNQSITPRVRPKVLIKSGIYVTGPPISGTYTFVRRVEPSITLTKHDFQGMYIIPPGNSFTLIFLSPGEVDIKAKVAFGWWEEKRCD